MPPSSLDVEEVVVGAAGGHGGLAFGVVVVCVEVEVEVVLGFVLVVLGLVELVLKGSSGSWGRDVGGVT